MPRRRTRLSALDAVLRFHRGQIEIGTGLEGQGDGADVLLGGGIHVEQVFDAVELLFNQRNRSFLDHRG
jgi:hypothetical protein